MLTARTEDAAQQLLALSIRVHVRRVEEVDSRVKRGVDHLARASFIDSSSEVVAPHPNNGDGQAPDFSVFHREPRPPQFRPAQLGWSPRPDVRRETRPIAS